MMWTRVVALACFAGSVALGQINMDIKDGSTSVDLFVLEKGAASGTFSASADGLGVSAGVDAMGLDIDVDNAGLLVGKSFEATLFSNGEFTGRGSVNLGIKVKGLAKTTIDALRGRCATLTIQQPFKVHTASRAEQAMLVTSQTVRAGDRSGTCAITVEPGGSIAMDFELFGTCDDQEKDRPGAGPFHAIGGVDPCVASKLGMLRDSDGVLPLYEQVWMINAACEAMGLRFDDALMIVERPAGAHPTSWANGLSGIEGVAEIEEFLQNDRRDEARITFFFAEGIFIDVNAREFRSHFGSIVGHYPGSDALALRRLDARVKPAYLTNFVGPMVARRLRSDAPTYLTGAGLRLDAPVARGIFDGVVVSIGGPYVEEYGEELAGSAAHILRSRSTK